MRLSVTALALVALVWSVLAYRTVQGRGPGSGDVAAGLAGMAELLHLFLVGAGGVGAALLSYIARRRAPDSLLATVALSVSITTVIAGGMLVALLFA